MRTLKRRDVLYSQDRSGTRSTIVVASSAQSLG